MKFRIGGLEVVQTSYETVDDALEEKAVKLAELGRSQPQHDPSGFSIALFFFLLGIAWIELRNLVKRRKKKDHRTDFSSGEQLVNSVEAEANRKFTAHSSITLEEANGMAIIEIVRKEQLHIKVYPSNTGEEKVAQAIRMKYENVIEVISRLP